MLGLTLQQRGILAINKGLTRWASEKEKAVARENFRVALKVAGDAKKRFQPARRVSSPGTTPRFEIGDERDPQGRLLPHVRQGQLRNSIRAIRGQGIRAYVEAGVGDSYEYAAHVEFGSRDGRHPRPHPYLFPAAEENRRPHKEAMAAAYRTRVAI